MKKIKPSEIRSGMMMVASFKGADPVVLKKNGHEKGEVILIIKCDPGSTFVREHYADVRYLLRGKVKHNSRAYITMHYRLLEANESKRKET